MNPIFHKRISRRTVLRGAGAALALPWLDAMSPALARGSSTEKPPVRAAFLYMCNGVRPDHWSPTGSSEQFELTPMLRSLANVKDEILLLENLWNEQTVGRNGHWNKVPAFLSGGYVARTSGRDLDSGGTSVDQVIAQQIGSRTPLPSLELGVDEPYTGVDNVGGGFTRVYGSHIAWRDPHTPVAKEIVPRLAFDRLFRTGPASPPISGFGGSRQPEVAKSLARDDTSVLDLVLQDAAALRSRVGANDRAKLDEYLDSVRSVERRIESSLAPQKRWINEGRFEVPRPGPGIPESHEEHVRLMADILVLAFWTDATRVATYMLTNAQTNRDFAFVTGKPGGFHSISHHKDEPDQLEQFEQIGTWHVDQVAYLLERMKSLDEGGTSLLDNSMVLFGTAIRDGNKHDEKNLPLFLAGRAGGAIRPGRRLRAPSDTPLCNLYLWMLNHLGIESDRFGDSTGLLTGLS